MQSTLNLLKKPTLKDLLCEQARRSFWHYCELREPEFYIDSRKHLVTLCTILNNFYYRLPLDETGRVYRKLAVSMPPQHGKTRTFFNWFTWVLGKNNEERIIAGSYNEITASDLGRYTRDTIKETKNTLDQFVFSDIFPETQMKYGAESALKWALDGQHFNFLSTSPGGTSTGKGATIKYFDDMVKNHKEALNENSMEEVFLWMTSTMASRNDPIAKSDILEVMCMTRWAKYDPIGRRLENEPDEWFELVMPAYNEETGKMLCDDFLNKDKYDDLKKAAEGKDIPWAIFQANYNQVCLDIQGKLYKTFNTYTKLPEDNDGNSLIEWIGAYCDTADEGDDFLVLIIFGVYQGRAYLIDVYMTTEGMEKTEPETAKRLHEKEVNRALIESNSGGRGFARNVKRILWEDYESRKTLVQWFHQSKNKRGRILGESGTVQENILYPVDWIERWPQFSAHIRAYMKDGKNTHDDPEDCLTGVSEMTNPGSKSKLKFGG